MSPAATMTIDDAARSVLDTADALFYERGIAGVSISDIRDASGVSLRRLYSMYPSKRELVTAWLNDRHTRWMDWFTAAVQRHVALGTDPLLATIDALREWVRSPGYRGCAFLNAIAETTEIDATHRRIVADHKHSLVELLATLAARRHPDAPTWIPAAFGVLLDGAIVQTAVFGNEHPIDAARHLAEQLLETI